MTFRAVRALGLAVLPVLSLLRAAQDKPVPGAASATPPAVAADYPTDRTGVLIGSPGWSSIPSEAPAKIHLKHGLAPALTYGIAPAGAISEYGGEHAAVEVEPGRPIICICHIASLPGNPALVRLHPQKNARELDAGKIHIGAKIGQAEKADLIAIDVSQPEDTVWLVQPQQPLAAGEYALMPGSQNMSIYAFTVAGGSPAGPKKH
jgi:hypothetical protein